MKEDLGPSWQARHDEADKLHESRIAMTKRSMKQAEVALSWWCAIAVAIPAAYGQAGPASKPGPKPEPRFTKPPKGAIVLFDGTDADPWTRMNGKPIPWRVVDGAMVCMPLTGNIRTKKTFRDIKLHLEFMTPYMPWFSGQARGNSGVFLPGRYEVQILDSYGIETPKKNDCGALYGRIAPATNACLPPKQWQSYDITYRAPRRGEADGKPRPGRITVVHNGITVIDDEQIPARGKRGKAGVPGPIVLQDHVCPVAFRNIWVVPLD